MPFLGYNFIQGTLNYNNLGCLVYNFYNKQKIWTTFLLWTLIEVQFLQNLIKYFMFRSIIQKILIVANIRKFYVDVLLFPIHNATLNIFKLF